jgi:hypothetical protein
MLESTVVTKPALSTASVLASLPPVTAPSARRHSICEANGGKRQSLGTRHRQSQKRSHAGRVTEGVEVYTPSEPGAYPDVEVLGEASEGGAYVAHDGLSPQQHAVHP